MKHPQDLSSTVELESRLARCIKTSFTARNKRIGSSPEKYYNMLTGGYLPPDNYHKISVRR